MALLLCALATPLAALALFAESRSHFYRPWGSHDWNSSASLALAENLSVERGLLRFHRLPVDEVSVYNRFPVGGLALIRLAIDPFEGLGAKVLAARVLMLTLFAAAALLAYLALRRIVDDPWIAAGATALACSSFYCVYYSDMISTEVAMDLFAVMLVWHGLALYVQDGRFRQLVVKICLALLIGWHVFALLLAFIALALAGQMWRAWRSRGTQRWRPWLSSVGKHVALGAVALLFGLSVLSFNLLTEYWAMRPDSVWDLPTTRSMAYRFGIERSSRPTYPDYLDLGTVLRGQIYRVGAMMLPNPVPDVLPNYPIAEIHHPYGHWIVRTVLVVGAISLPLCFAALWFAKHRLLLGSLALSGMVWALSMHASVSYHDFEAVFHIGVPLAFFSIALLWLRGRLGENVVRASATVALVVLVFCNVQMSRLGRDADEIRLQAESRAEMQAIRGQLVDGDRVAAVGDFAPPLGAHFALDYYLSGIVLLAGKRDRGGVAWPVEGTDFAIATRRIGSVASLTPGNKHVFLYDRATLGADAARTDAARSAD